MFDLTPFRNSLPAGSWLADDLFPEWFGDQSLQRRLANFKTDVSDDGKNYLIEAELPGFKKEEIQVELDQDRLTISAQHNEAKEEKEKNYIRKERHFGQVVRSFILDNVDAATIKAEFKEGVLRLTLPKLQEAPIQKRQIEIK